MWLAYAAMWISTAIATCVGIYVTGSAWCLWALLIPACIKVTRSNNGSKEEADEKTKS